MFTNRFSKYFTGLLIIVVALLSASFVSRNFSVKIDTGKAPAVPNTYLPLAPGKQTLLVTAARGATDFHQRHNNWNWSVSAPAYSDYYQRHAEQSNLAALGQGASDYAERHPELSAGAGSSVDLSDYYFRHMSQ